MSHFRVFIDEKIKDNLPFNLNLITPFLLKLLYLILILHFLYHSLKFNERIKKKYNVFIPEFLNVK